MMVEISEKIRKEILPDDEVEDLDLEAAALEVEGTEAQPADAE